MIHVDSFIPTPNRSKSHGRFQWEVHESINLVWTDVKASALLRVQQSGKVSMILARCIVHCSCIPQP
jgi:hypothetical protein